MTNVGLRVSAGSRNQRSSDRFFLRICPIKHHFLWIEVNAFNSGLIFDNVKLPQLLADGLAIDLLSRRVQQFGLNSVTRSAYPTEAVSECKTFSTRAIVGAFEVGTNLGAVVTKVGAFINVVTFLRIVFIDLETSIAKTEIT